MSFPAKLLVTVENAVNLEAADFGGKSDPYVLVQAKSISDKKLDCNYKACGEGWKQKTSIKKKNLNPTWNESMTFYSLSFLPDNSEGIKLVFKVYDWDLLSKDDKIGNAEIILKPSELENEKKYSASLKLKDCKSGTLNISYSVSNLSQSIASLNQRVLKDEFLDEFKFQYHSPFTPSTCELCIPNKFSLLSTSGDTESSRATFVDLNGQGVIVVIVKKLTESVDFSKYEKGASEHQVREMKKKYLNVVVESNNFDVKPDPHCKNEKITNIFEMVLNLESAGGTKMIGTMRIVLHSNNYLVTYVFMEHDTYQRLGVIELARISENSTFFDP